MTKLNKLELRVLGIALSYLIACRAQCDGDDPTGGALDDLEEEMAGDEDWELPDFLLQLEEMLETLAQ